MIKTECIAAKTYKVCRLAKQRRKTYKVCCLAKQLYKNL